MEKKHRSETTDHIINHLFHNYKDGYTLPEAYVIEYNASIEDVMDAIEYIAKTNWLKTNLLYARKIIYKSTDSIGETKLVLSIQITTNLDDFEYLEKQGYSSIIDTFPLITWNSSQNGVTIFEDNKTYTLEEWKVKHEIKKIKKNEAVIFCEPSSNQEYNKKWKVAYFTGKTIKDNQTNETYYELTDKLDSPESHKDYFVQGIDVATYIKRNFFLTFPEYLFELNCQKEALEKSMMLLNNTELKLK